MQILVVMCEVGFALKQDVLHWALICCSLNIKFSSKASVKFYSVLESK